MRTFTLVASLASVLAQSAFEPWGIHQAYGADPQTAITVMWSTNSPTQGSFVRYGLTDDALNTTVAGTSYTFFPAGNTAPQDLHRVFLTGLPVGFSGRYAVGDSAGNISATFALKTQPATWLPTLAIYGDMGISTNALATMPLLIADVAAGNLDAVLHIGDIAYNLDSNGGATGDAWMKQVQPVMANVPYRAWGKCWRRVCVAAALCAPLSVWLLRCARPTREPWSQARPTPLPHPAPPRADTCPGNHEDAAGAVGGGAGAGGVECALGALDSLFWGYAQPPSLHTIRATPP
jgi:hypothetical protein